MYLLPSAGKTRLALCLIYRLIKAGRFRRVLFLVDRTALGEQAHDAFKDVRLENLQSFTDIYDVKKLGDIKPEADTRLHFATVQGMVKRLSDADADPVPVDWYDCVIVDECHRGYALDQEMSETQVQYRSEADYISKYRRVLDHFDAVRIGLTATPALHTTQIFDKPIYEYGYRQAVIDGHLVDYEPPIRILTKLNQDGIHWDVGAKVTVYDTGTGQIELFDTPDEIDIDVEGFNTKVLTEGFNRAVCGYLAEQIDPVTDPWRSAIEGRNLRNGQEEGWRKALETLDVDPETDLKELLHVCLGHVGVDRGATPEQRRLARSEISPE